MIIITIVTSRKENLPSWVNLELSLHSTIRKHWSVLSSSCCCLHQSSQNGKHVQSLSMRLKDSLIPKTHSLEPFQSISDHLKPSRTMYGWDGIQLRMYNHNSTLALGTLTQFAVSSITSKPKCPWLRITIHLIASTFWAPGSSATTPVCPRSGTSPSWPWLQVLVVAIGIEILTFCSIIRMKMILFRLEESQSRSITDDELRRRRLERFSWQSGSRSWCWMCWVGNVSKCGELDNVRVVLILKKYSERGSSSLSSFSSWSRSRLVNFFHGKLYFLFLALGQSLVHFLEQQGRFLLLQVIACIMCHVICVLYITHINQNPCNCLFVLMPNKYTTHNLRNLQNKKNEETNKQGRIKT